MTGIGFGLNASANNDAQWQHRTRLDAPQRMLPLGLGAAVAASETGVIVVGGGHDSDIGVDAGAVAIWNCSINGVTAQERITHPKDHRQSAFGQALAIDPAGSVLCIGAPNEDGVEKDSGKWPDNFQMGRVYLYIYGCTKASLLYHFRLQACALAQALPFMVRQLWLDRRVSAGLVLAVVV